MKHQIKAATAFLIFLVTLFIPEILHSESLDGCYVNEYGDTIFIDNGHFIRKENELGLVAPGLITADCTIDERNGDFIRINSIDVRKRLFADMSIDYYFDKDSLDTDSVTIAFNFPNFSEECYLYASKYDDMSWLTITFNKPMLATYLEHEFRYTRQDSIVKISRDIDPFFFCVIPSALPGMTYDLVFNGIIRYPSPCVIPIHSASKIEINMPNVTTDIFFLQYFKDFWVEASEKRIIFQGRGEYVRLENYPFKK